MSEGGTGKKKTVVVGGYRLGKLLSDNEITETFEAVQLSVGRKVALTRLKIDRRDDAGQVAKFRREIRAKAAATHPYIAAVYEANESSDAFFYTSEIVQGDSINRLQENGNVVRTETLWRILQAVCESVSYLEKNGIHYRALKPDDLVVHQGEPNLINFATAEHSQESARAGTRKMLAEYLPLILNDAEAHLPVVADLLRRLDPGQEDAFEDWETILTSVQSAEKVTGEGFQRTDPKLGQRTKQSLARAELRPQRTPYYVLAGALGLIMMASVAAWIWMNRPVPAREFDGAVHIEAGPFVFGDGLESDLPDYWISEHEVTIGQYSLFLEAAAGAPEGAYDQPGQPEEFSSHRPADWKELFRAAQSGEFYKGMPVDLNCPMINVNWWNAAAYAKWAGGHLPSAAEWEKAARGTKGNLFPWGNEDQLKKLNSGADLETGGNIDGFVGWAQVDATPDDRSTYGVVGMAGNVSEWTRDWTDHPDFPDHKVPVIKGASFISTRNHDLSAKRSCDADSEELWIGFRVMWDRPPEKK